jgi:hypothetical protein
VGTPERSLPDTCSGVALLVCLTCRNVVQGHSALEAVAQSAPVVAPREAGAQASPRGPSCLARISEKRRRHGQKIGARGGTIAQPRARLSEHSHRSNSGLGWSHTLALLCRARHRSASVTKSVGALAFRAERKLPPLRSLRSLRVGTVTDVERVDEGSRDEVDGVGQEPRLGTGVDLVTSRITLQRLRIPGVRRGLVVACQDIGCPRRRCRTSPPVLSALPR